MTTKKGNSWEGACAEGREEERRACFETSVKGILIQLIFFFFFFFALADGGSRRAKQK